MIIAAYAIGADEGYVYVPRRVSAGRPAAAARHRAGRGEGLPGREHPRLRLQLRSEDQGGRRRLRLRRRDRADRLHRGQARHAAPAPAVPGAEGPVGQADQHQQRRDLRQRPLDHPQRRRGLRRHAAPRRARAPRSSPWPARSTHRPGRGPHGHHPPRDHLRHRRRHHATGKQFKAVQIGGPSGGCIPASPATLPIDYETAQPDRRHHGLGRHGRHGRDHLHGRHRPLLPALHPGRILRQVHLCRIGTKRMLEILERITEGKGAGGRHRAAGGPGRPDPQATPSAAWARPRPTRCSPRCKYFRDEYEAHIRDKKCPAHSCAALLTFTILEDKCTGCTLCARDCPVQGHHRREEEVHTSSTRPPASSAANVSKPVISSAIRKD